MVFRQEIKIPKDRIAVLIGKKGSVKRALEKLADAKITVDSQEGDVVVGGEDNLRLFNLKNVIKAIGRGFSPHVAKSLFDEAYIFDLVGIQEYTGKSPKKQKRIKGRLIGTKGKTRELIAKLTNTNIVIYGKTIGIIGLVEDVMLAKEAIEYLLSGAPHGNVYRFLERKRIEAKKKGGANYGFGEVDEGYKK